MASVSQAAAGPRFGVGYRSWLLALLVAIYACSFVDRVIISTVGPAIIRELKLSDLQFGVLGGLAFALFYAAFGIPIAWLAERRSRVGIIAVCIALWSLMTVLCGFTQAYWQLLLCRMGVGVGEGGCSPAAHSLISDHYPPRKRASALAIYSIGVPIGSMLGAVAGGFIAEAFSWRAALVVVGLPGLLLALLARFTLREPARGRSEGLAVADKAPPLPEVLKRLVRKPTVVLFILGMVFTNLAASSVSVFTPLYLVRSFHLGLARVGLLYGMVVGVSGVVGMLAGGFGADAAGARDARWYAWGPAIGSALAFPAYLLAFSRQDAGAAVGFIFLGYLLLSLYFAPTFAVVQNLMEPRMRASASALLFLAINIVGQGLGPTVMGLTSDLFAARLFAPGDYHSLCPAVRGAPTAVAAACAHASAAGLQRSILLICGFFLCGSAMYAAASRLIRRDLGDRAAR